MNFSLCAIVRKALGKLLGPALAGAGSFVLVFVSCAAVLDVSFELATLGATVAGLATFGSGCAGEFDD